MSERAVNQPAPWDLKYSPATPGLPVEITTQRALRERMGDDHLSRAFRVTFHVVLICTRGEGRHEVDFTSVPLNARRVVHVRPGQVHRWNFEQSYSATLILFPDIPELRPGGWPVVARWFDLDDAEWRQASSIIELTRREIELQRPPERRDLSLRGALQMLIIALGLDLPRHFDNAQLPPPYMALLRQLDEEPDWSRSVTERARRLGYSQRTLTRACLAATGRTAKEVIDGRILMEAQRMLVDGDPLVADVAEQLGFAEPGNFTKFFRRLAGEGPARWRQHQSGRGQPIA